MPQPNDLSRSLVALDQNSTVIAVVEMSQSTWLVGGILPSIERTIELTAAVDFKRRGVATKVVLPGLTPQNQPSRCDPALIKAVVRGRAWFEELATGRVRSLEELATGCPITRGAGQARRHHAALHPAPH